MARYNTSSASNTITGTATISSPFQGAFTEFTGTAPYTVTLPAPSAFPGVNQTFYNATGGVVTVSTPSGAFTGTGGPNAGTFAVNSGNVLTVVPDGTNYIVISEDGSPLVATTGSFSGDVNITGGVTTLTPSGFSLTPGGSSGSINNVSIGATTRLTGAFTTLAANQAVVFTANTSSSSTTTGTLVVTGGIGASGNIYSGASIFATNLTGTLQTAAQANITSTGSLTIPGLTVDNSITAGTSNSTGGSTLIQNKYGTGQFVTIIGEEYSTGAPSINYAVRNSTNSTGFISSADNVAWQRGYLKVGGGAALRLGAAAGATVAVGTSVAVPEILRVDVTGRITAGGTNSNTVATDYAYTFDYEPTRNTWPTISSDGARTHALMVRTPVLDSTNVDAIVISESGGQASGRNSLTWWNEDYNGGAGYRKARMYTQVGGSYADTAWYLDVADASRAIQNRLTVNSAGNLGINNTSPAARLDIVGGSQALFKFKGSSAGYNYGAFTASNGSDIGYIGSGGGGAFSAGTEADFGVRGQTSLNFGIGNTVSMSINNSNNVSISNTLTATTVNSAYEQFNLNTGSFPANTSWYTIYSGYNGHAAWEFSVDVGDSGFHNTGWVRVECCYVVPGIQYFHCGAGYSADIQFRITGSTYNWNVEARCAQTAPYGQYVYWKSRRLNT